MTLRMHNINFELLCQPSCSSQNVLGEPGRGFIYAMNAFDRTRPAVS